MELKETECFFDLSVKDLEKRIEKYRNFLNNIKDLGGYSECKSYYGSELIKLQTALAFKSAK